jgi:hypothetical protein
MASLLEIDAVAQAELKKHCSLQPVNLKHALPERPFRTLGLVKIDGAVFSADKLSRAVFLRISLPCYLRIRSLFIRPRMEYDLPVFATEVMATGSKRMVLVDIHRTGQNTGHDDRALFERLTAVRGQYPELAAHAITQKGKIQEVFSPAACQVRIPSALDEQALSLFRQYLRVFIDLVAGAEPLAGAVLEKTRQAYEDYLKTIVDHDPGVKGFKLLFGEQGGVERSMNMHFDR